LRQRSELGTSQSTEDTASDGDGLTDADVLAILNSRGMGGPTITPAVYDTISDWDLIHIYLAPRDQDGTLVTLRTRIRRAAGWPGEPEEDGEPLPDPLASLNVPRDALLMGVPTDYVCMFFQVWRNRGLSDEETMVKFRQLVKEVPPIGFERS
jgi:hypothetical protein